LQEQSSDAFWMPCYCVRRHEMTISANNRPALDAAAAPGLHFGSHWRGTSEAGRSVE